MSDGEAASNVEMAVAPAEPMSVDDAIQAVLKKALSHDGLVRGLHEVVRALEKGQAQLTFLAEDSDQPEYKKLVEALCKERSVPLISIPARKQLGQFCGLCKVDASGEARKVVNCTAAVITDFGSDSEALQVIKNLTKA